MSRCEEVAAASHRCARYVMLCLLACIAGSGCRTGSDGDPWGVDVDPEEVDTDATDDDTDTGGNASEETDSNGDDSATDTDEEEDTAVTDETNTDEPADVIGEVTDNTPEPEACEPSREVCDGEDNDCDGEVDEGYICPADGTIVDPEPFEGGVYFVGTTAEGAAGATALQRFWPSLHDSYINGFGYYDDDFVLRQSDWQLFYLDTSRLYGRVDGEVPITNCSATMMRHYDFDASNTLYYSCPDGLFHGDGEVVSEQAAQLLGVTNDGRLAVRSDGRFGYFDADRQLHLSDLEVAGSLVFESSRGFGDNVFALYARDVPEPEQIIFKFDGNSEWSVMRRVPTEFSTADVVALPDGTLFLVSADSIIGYFPDGTEQTVWEETDKEVRMHGRRGLFLGPLDPAEIVQ